MGLRLRTRLRRHVFLAGREVYDGFGELIGIPRMLHDFHGGGGAPFLWVVVASLLDQTKGVSVKDSTVVASFLDAHCWQYTQRSRIRGRN